MGQSGLYLVTGAAGFVGSNLVHHLVRQGHRVKAMVRSPDQVGPLQSQGLETVIADLKDSDSLRRAVTGVFGVYHIAATFRQAGLPEAEFYDVNAAGTRRLLDVSIDAGVTRFIHCSTVGVLGHIAHPPADETTEYNPGDMYQRSKVEGEKIALDYFRSKKLSGVVIRPAMIYGPGDMRTLKLFKMIRNRRFFYVGDGRIFVHFVDVRDLARAFSLAMDNQELHGEIYIIAGQRATPLKELVNLIAARLGVPPPRIHLPVRPVQMLGTVCESICTPFRIQPPIFRRRVDFFTKSRHFDGAKAARDLGYVPAQKLEGEIEDIISWYRDNAHL